MQSNNISLIQSSAFSYLNKLNDLYLSFNPVDSLHLKTVVNLYLDNCNLRQLTIDQPDRLETLNLNLNFIVDKSSIGLDLYVNLKNLNLANNNLTSLDLFSNEKLTQLTLSQNYLESIEFPDLSSITNLDLSSNRFTHINKNLFSNLKKLENLDLASNLIEKIESKSFDSNRNLKKLILSNNFLSTVPDIHLLSNLQELNLFNQNANLISLPNNAFERILNPANILESNLEINLLRNSISNFSPKTFCSQFSYSLAMNSIKIYFDNLTNMNECILNQLKSDSIQITSYEANDSLKCQASFNNITLSGLNWNNSICLNYTSNCSLSKYLCPKDSDFIRYTTWITGDPHVYSYKSNYELCNLGNETICIQNSKIKILCTDKILKDSDNFTIASALSDIKIYFNSGNRNFSFIANQTNYPENFCNGKKVIYSNDSLTSEDSKLIELMVYSEDTRIIYDFESRTHFLISKWNSYYSLTVRGTHNFYSNSSGVLLDGCKSGNKKFLKRDKKFSSMDVCGQKCQDFNSTSGDEKISQDILYKMCIFDCTQAGPEFVEMLKSTLKSIELINRTDTYPIIPSKRFITSFSIRLNKKSGFGIKIFYFILYLFFVNL